MTTSHLVPLSLSSLDRLAEGEAGRVIDQAIRRCLEDLNQRPNNKARKVEIVLSLSLDTETARICATLSATPKLPAGTTKGIACSVSVSGASVEALFNPCSRDNLDQLPLWTDPDNEE